MAHATGLGAESGSGQAQLRPLRKSSSTLPSTKIANRGNAAQIPETSNGASTSRNVNIHIVSNSTSSTSLYPCASSSVSDGQLTGLQNIDELKQRKTKGRLAEEALYEDRVEALDAAMRIFLDKSRHLSIHLHIENRRKHKALKKVVSAADRTISTTNEHGTSSNDIIEGDKTNTLQQSTVPRAIKNFSLPSKQFHLALRNLVQSYMKLFHSLATFAQAAASAPNGDVHSVVAKTNAHYEALCLLNIGHIVRLYPSQLRNIIFDIFKVHGQQSQVALV